MIPIVTSPLCHSNTTVSLGHKTCFVSVHMWWMYVHVPMCAHMYPCMWKSEADVGCLSLLLATSLSAPGAHWAGWAAIGTSPSPQWITAHTCSFMWVLGAKLACWDCRGSKHLHSLLTTCSVQSRDDLLVPEISHFQSVFTSRTATEATRTENPSV